MPRFLNEDGYEPIAGSPTMFRAPEGNIVHFSHEEQAAKGWVSRAPGRPRVTPEPAPVTERNLGELPISAWGRHDLVAEIERLRETGGPCSMCRGTGKNLLGLGPSCQVCAGSGHRTKEVEGLYRALHNADRAYEETKQKADAHRRQRDELLSKLESPSDRNKS